MTGAFGHGARAVLGIAFALVVLCGLPRLAGAIAIKEVTSPGGITAWLIEERTVPLLSMGFAFRGGAALDPAGKGGLAEFVSALLDEGAGPYAAAEFQKRLEENSISMRFSAGFDFFGGRVRALNDHRAEAFDLLRLALTSPRFDREPVARVRDQLLSAVRREMDRPRSMASRLWHRTVFPDHPYGRDVDGRAETITAITADDLHGFVGRRFGRDNLIVAVVGDIGPDQLAPLLDRAFGSLPEKAAPYTLPEAEVRGAGKVLVVEREIPQTVAIFGQSGIKHTDPDFHAAHVMNHVLGGGTLTSRLGDEVRERRGLAYSVYTRLVSYDRAGLVMGWVATQNRKIAESLAVIRAEFARMAKEPVPAAELEDAKRYLTGAFFTRLNSTSRIANLLVGIQLDRLGIDYLERRNALIGAVTAEDVQRVARRLLDPERLTVVMVGKPAGVTATP